MTSRCLAPIAALALWHVACSGAEAPGQIEGLQPFRGRLALPTDTWKRIDVVAQDYQAIGDYLSVTGTASGSESSSFILKRDGKNLYGWVVLPDEDVAYEYKTSPHGDLVVEKVLVTDIYPVCDPDPDPATDGADFADAPAFDMQPADPPHVGAYDGTADTNKLQSKPGATKVLYMDIAPLTLAKPELWRAWQVVAASFSAFDVNVTTDGAVYEAAMPRDRGKACSRNMAGRSSCGLNAFGTTRCCNVFNKGNGYYQGATTAHELGHLMGLRHDGSEGGGEYFRGLPAFRWCPIMGANTPKTSWGQQALFQWSKGEYMGANNKEDDLAIISRNLPFRKDDIPDSKPLVIRNGSEVSATDNRGQIETNTDSDAFTFTVGGAGGRAVLTVDRIEFVGGAYLDVEAQIQNASGMMLARANDMAARSAKLDVMLPAGVYRLIVKGGAEGTPQNGFSNYSSLGFYGVSGTINAAVGGGAPGPDGGTPGADAGTGGSGGGGAMDAGGGRDAIARDEGSASDTATAIDGGAGSGAGGAGGNGGSAGTAGSGGSGGRTGGGGRTGTGGGPPPTEPTPAPIVGGCGCAVGTAGGAPSSAGVAGLLLATLLAARRRRRAPRPGQGPVF